MNLHGHDIGVCSWSLQPRSTEELLATLAKLKLSHLQLAMGPLVTLSDTARRDEIARVRDAGVVVTAGMIGFSGEDYSTIDQIRRTGGFVPDAEWTGRRRLTALAGKLAASMGVKRVSTHIGFVAPPGEPGYQTMLDRVREIAAAFAAEHVELLMETGQEPAAELLQFLNDLAVPNVGINFDPANMILYGAGDPIEAIGILAPHIRHVHIKDATASAQPGATWGEEVPFGTGQVGAVRFLSAIDAIGYRGPLMIEREAGNDRAGDVGKAIEVIAAST